MHRYEWRKVYTFRTPKLLNLLDAFQLMFETRLPDIAQHFTDAGLQIKT
jgi:hypothetical protein